MKYLLVTGIAIVCQLGYAQTCDLTIVLTNLKNTKGQIQIGIYNQPETFPKEDEQSKEIWVDKKNIDGKYTINDLPAGEYAIALFDDENSDGICNRNLLGFPKEGYGFSKNARPRFSAPTFAECKIDLIGNLTITIELVY